MYCIGIVLLVTAIGHFEYLLNIIMLNGKKKICWLLLIVCMIIEYESFRTKYSMEWHCIKITTWHCTWCIRKTFTILEGILYACYILLNFHHSFHCYESFQNVRWFLYKSYCYFFFHLFCSLTVYECVNECFFLYFC